MKKIIGIIQIILLILLALFFINYKIIMKV